MQSKTVPPGTIVVGVDGSVSAQRAIDWAIEQARRAGLALTLVHGIDPARSVWMDPVGGVDHEAIFDAIRDDAAVLLAEAREYAVSRAPDLVVHDLVVGADPRVALLKLSADAALVVIGSRGRGPIRGLLLGSVGVAIIQQAACPVVVVRPDDAPGGSALDRPHRGVLVGVDGSPTSAQTAEFAYQQAALHDLPLTIVHCAWEWQPTRTDEEIRSAAIEPLAGLAERYPSVRATVEIVHQDPADYLAQESRRRDLVVVGAHHGNRLTAFVYGSVARAVVEHATGPVVIVPQPAADAESDSGPGLAADSGPGDE